MLLNAHFKTSHANTTEWRCAKCSRRFKSHKILVVHDYHYHEQGQFECTNGQCHFTGDTRVEVMLHQQRDHTARNYRCRFAGCIKEFKSDTMLARHERVHLSIKPFQCAWPDCSYSSTVRGSVTKHIRTVHFKLPKSIKEQKQRGIVDDRKPEDYIEVDQDLLARRLQ